MKHFSVLVFVMVLALGLWGCQAPVNQTTSQSSSQNETNASESSQNAMKSISLNEARLIAEKFVNEELLPPGQTVEIQSFVDDGALFKMDMNIGGQNLQAYLTKDGENFFPQAMNIEQVRQQKAEAAEAAETQKQELLASIPKSDVVDVELFIMTHCPFGTQMEKGIIPVVETLGDNINFELKFNSYAMHDKVEIEEQILQHCIKTETPDQLLPYLKCFLAEGDTAGCLPEINATEETYAGCIAGVEEEYGIWADYEDQSTWTGRFPSFSLYKEDNEKYGVQGSPTLVINGEVVRTARDSATLLETVCAGFNEPPAECETELPSTAPSSGFGFGSAPASSSTASCG